VKIDVSILKKNIGKSINYQERIPAKQLASKDLKFAADSFVDVDLTLTNLGTMITVKGVIEAELVLDCSRCLVDYTYHLSLEVEEDFYNQGDLPQSYAEEIQLSTDDLRFASYQGDMIDLSETIRENILLNVPIKTICDQTCRGICAQCGINLNEKQCQCKDERIDLRLEALKKLLSDEGK
jgi:uncharacterized protein